MAIRHFYVWWTRFWKPMDSNQQEKRAERNIAAVIWFRVFREYDIRASQVWFNGQPCPNPGWTLPVHYLKSEYLGGSPQHIATQWFAKQYSLYETYCFIKYWYTAFCWDPPHNSPIHKSCIKYWMADNTLATTYYQTYTKNSRPFKRHIVLQSARHQPIADTYPSGTSTYFAL